MPASRLFRPSITRRLGSALAGTLFALLLTTALWSQSAPAQPQQPSTPAHPASPNDTQPAPGAGAAVQGQQQSGASPDQNNSGESQDQPEPEGHITKQQAKDLFRSVDEILGFVSGDTGMPIEHKVKRNLITREQVEKYVDKRMKDDKDEKRLEQARLVLQ